MRVIHDDDSTDDEGVTEQYCEADVCIPAVGESEGESEDEEPTASEAATEWILENLPRVHIEGEGLLPRKQSLDWGRGRYILLGLVGGRGKQGECEHSLLTINEVIISTEGEVSQKRNYVRAINLRTP